MNLPSPTLPTVDLPEFLARAQARAARARSLLRQVARTQNLTVEEVHDLHRDLRRVRFDLRLLRRTLPKPERAKLEVIDGVLADLTRRTGSVRDRDVLESILVRFEVEEEGKAREAAHVLAGQLHRESLELRKELARAVGASLRDGGISFVPLWGQVRKLRSGKARFARACARELDETYETFQRAFLAAVKRPSVRRLHRFRIALRKLRQLRYAVARDLATYDVGPRWATLQSRLGSHHDLGVLEEWMRPLPRTDERRRVKRLVRKGLDRGKVRLQKSIATYA